MLFSGNNGYNPEMNAHGTTESHLQTMLEHLLQLANSSGLEGDSESNNGINCRIYYFFYNLLSLQILSIRL